MAAQTAKSSIFATQLSPNFIETNRMEMVNRCCRHDWNKCEYRAHDRYYFRGSIRTGVGEHRRVHIDNG